jgi:hypothetical protein
MASYDRRKLTRSYFYSGTDLLFSPTNHVKIFIRDNCKNAIGKIKRYVEENQDKQVYLIEHPDSSNKVDTAFITMITYNFGGYTPELASNLPEIPKEYAQRKKPPVVYAHSMSRTRFYGDSIYNWERIYDEEELEGGYYMTYDTFPRIDADSYDLETVGKVFRAKLFDKPIYVIKNTKADLLKSNPNFTCAIEKAKEIIDEVSKQVMKTETSINRYKASINLSKKTQEIFNNCGVSKLSESAMRDIFPKGHFVNNIHRIHKLSTTYRKKMADRLANEPNGLLRTLLEEKMETYETLPVKYDNVIPDGDVEKFLETYPMMQLVGRLGRYNEPQNLETNIVNYIKMVDSSSN